eukprot:gene8053-9462_t
MSEAKTQFGSNENYDQAVNTLLTSFIPTGDDMYQHKDEISHFLVRMAMSQRREDREWMIHAECLLLKYRLERAETDKLQAFLAKHSDFGWSSITEEEHKKYYEQLYYLTLTVLESSQFFKIPFQEVSSLIARRRAILINGMAYLSIGDVKDVIIDSFKSYLLFAMERIAADLPRLKEQHPAIVDFFGTLPRFGGVMTASHGKITPQEIVPVSRVSFALCMRVMNDSLIKDGRLKHEGRLQLSTFLKAIGLSYEDAYAYWKQAFSKRLSGSDFDKEHLYNLRHTYGLEGKAISYSPYSCGKIIEKVPKSTDEVHGCPYLWSEDKLTNKLRDIGIDEVAIADIVTASQISPNLSCAKFFDSQHAGNVFNIRVNHPNQYYDHSRDYHKKKEEAEQKLQQQMLQQ